jgi:hypothetical protein
MISKVSKAIFIVLEVTLNVASSFTLRGERVKLIHKLYFDVLSFLILHFNQRLGLHNR